MFEILGPNGKYTFHLFQFIPLSATCALESILRFPPKQSIASHIPLTDKSLYSQTNQSKSADYNGADDVGIGRGCS